jgi:hypothetical protein
MKNDGSSKTDDDAQRSAGFLPTHFGESFRQPGARIAAPRTPRKPLSVPVLLLF